jgi:tetratricopeptide (TPR) repeat protein
MSAHASYYASWTAWALGAAHFQAGDQAAAKASFETAVRHARRAVSQNRGSAEFHAMLANALIGLAITDRSQFQTLGPELVAARGTSLELAPRNPRVVMLDAGVIFNAPPERGGSREKGIARWLEAIGLFEQEVAARPVDELQPRWGREIAYGALSDLYLRMSPPDGEKARAAAEKALTLRPDFWYVKEIVLPKLKNAR